MSISFIFLETKDQKYFDQDPILSYKIQIFQIEEIVHNFECHQGG